MGIKRAKKVLFGIFTFLHLTTPICNKFKENTKTIINVQRKWPRNIPNTLNYIRSKMCLLMFFPPPLPPTLESSFS